MRSHHLLFTLIVLRVAREYLFTTSAQIEELLAMAKRTVQLLISKPSPSNGDSSPRRIPSLGSDSPETPPLIGGRIGVQLSLF